MTSPNGLRQLEAEMERQFSDAQATWNAVAAPAAEAARSMKATGRLLLLGMGGSHWVNRMAEPFYRQAGVDASAHVLSEYMRAPLDRPATLFLTSQSGASGEVVRFLDDQPQGTVFGLTLDPDSPLARRTRPLIGCGGVELAYAATRSLLVTLTMHAAVLAALGADMAPLRAVLEEASPPYSPELRDLIAEARNAVFVGRGALQGVADAAGLSLMELARIPVLGLEAGQFRHGPFEMVGPETAIVFLRGKGDEGDNIAGLAGELIGHGLRPGIVDLSGEAAVPGAVTLSLPPRRGMAAAAAALPALQRAVIDAAARMVPDVGMPIRSTKVTSGEAA
ncbi:SIS domain-containing protein [Maritimibacter sp. HL-12]|uniref:SIS domain-containing protein n=1 Tax=Maritimibacter sp. HL-12 TaxID=1162418 RepID=UPI000A0EFBB4|nr:SIS domain-containing protein [Maritimibacter sp. HL-12]SMH37904.1 Fructoselysine-6-P-deglycase FrlB with duplicated sugar isomerase (SIS) domain [Maritimibacter sp. HL-12]